jgi:hypothetical protein
MHPANMAMDRGTVYGGTVFSETFGPDADEHAAMSVDETSRPRAMNSRLARGFDMT